MKRTNLQTLILSVAALLTGTTTLFAQMGGPAPTVAVDKVVPVKEEGTRQYIGRLASTHSVALKARVSGYLKNVLSKEGDLVKAGDVVMEIEDTLYQAQVKSAEAKVEQKKAEVEYAEKNYKRQRGLLGIAAQSEMDEANRLLKLRQAELAECEAALVEARTNLSYTKVTSPITGRFGKSTYSPGNYLTPSSEDLGSIVQMSPIYLKMAISEPDYVRMFGSRENILKDAVIRMRTSDGKMFEETGYVKLIDNQIDPSTGTLMLWCVFPNASHRLIPGGVVDAFISKKSAQEYPAVPVSAVMLSKKGTYVYVVDSNNVAQMRPVIVGEIVGNKTIVRQGLSFGEMVVAEGTHKVMPGTPVNPVPMKKAESKPAGSGITPVSEPTSAKEGPKPLSSGNK